MSHLLSKSTYMRGKQCPKALWLYKHRRDLLPPIGAQQQAIFDSGTSVGLMAQQLFPGGVDCAPPSPFEFAQSVVDTAAAIARGERVIYEAAFMRDGVLAALDLLVHTAKGWKAFEVKGSTGVKDVYVQDAALQYYVISGSIALADVSIVYLNNSYVKQGAVDVQQLFNRTSVLAEVLREQAAIPARIEALKQVVQQEQAPVVDIGPQCDAPYPCDFKPHCWLHIPERSVFELTGATEQKWSLYQRGILKLVDIPENEKLSAAQRRQVNAWKSGEGHIQHEPLHQWLAALEYPVHHFDFETMMPSIPLYDGTRPFQQMPFQYSLHVQSAPSAPATHHEFLADGTSDPREALVQQLLKDIGPTGDILAYNATFERMVLRDLARDLPHHAPAIQQLLPRIKDLMDAFRHGWYYAPQMNGKYGIKTVLPALVPTLSYKTLNVQEGGTASLRFTQLASGTYTGNVPQLRTDLLAYCKMDTLAMVEVLGVLQQVVL
ncbi:MAG: DUF2779 domain-containing protein [Flavobacteriales bacterium]|nr:DUF2779 domain-containing protein [Flavobacteriales bacterium]MBK9533579.1 DUF2779 domain-containing protein [Flavobacteriales bacterium]MBP9136869.1 DUF2779 domain-containing protein [Flavobacteriales bacterium]HQV51666.1 DUF2779 domain-containing protein [Flavobacteriales bacterium]HQX29209.1 DUF2779 domain-containing protein [Flavobacteriales bacterium]